MEVWNDVFLFNSAYRRFEVGRISFDNLIRHVEWGASPMQGERRRYVVPGFCDIHMHIESSMMNPTEFSHASIIHGTTTIVSDCHEVANVFGLEGLESFMRFPVVNDTFYAVPSSVPASSSALETSGGAFDAYEAEKLCENKKIIALGEVMNAQDLFSSEDNRTKRIINVMRQKRPDCPLEGHCPDLSGALLDDFLASGVNSDHTSQTPASIREKSAKGMFLEIQYKSLSAENLKALSEIPGYFSFCTDDVLPDVLAAEGHLDRVLRKAIGLGMKPEEVVYAATTSPAMRMRLYDRGVLAPGKLADFVVLDDLQTLSIAQVYKQGRLVFDRERGLLVHQSLPEIPSSVLHSINRKPVVAEDFIPRCPDGKRNIMTIKHTPHSTMTEIGHKEVEVKDGTVPLEGLNIIASVERYGHQEPISVSLLEGGLTRRGAICSSWAHDSHNLLVMATDAEFAAKAVNLVITRQGGIAAVDETGVVFLPLAYGGIVSVDTWDGLSRGVSAIRTWLKDHGYQADEEVMSFAVLALPVSPRLKVTDKGLVDVHAKRLVDWRNG